MKGNYEFQMYIRSLYFELSDRFLVDSTDSILNQLADNLVHITNSNCVTIYLYNAWSQCFDKRALSSEKPLDLKKRFVCREGYDPDCELQRAHPEMAFQVMNIINDMHQFLVAVSKKTNAPDKMDWHILETETSTLLRNFSRMLRDHVQNKQLSILYDATVKLNELNAKSGVWLEMKHILEQAYPGYDYELLLSQDYQIDHILPVQMIADADEMSKRSGTKAFMTGDIEIENCKGTTSIYAPFVGDQGVYGVLKIISKQVIQFPDEERDFLMRFCGIVGKALENRNYVEQSNQSISNMKWLINVTQYLNQDLDLNDIIPMIRNRIIEISQASELGIVLIDEERNGVNEIHSESTDYFHSQEGSKFANYIKEKVQKEPGSILSGNMTNRTNLTTYGSVMAVPLHYSNKLGGMIIALHETRYYFSLETMKVTETFIQHSGLAVSNALLKAELKKNNITDDLTGLYTRRRVDEKVIEHMDSNTCGTLIFLDIDNFKYINDTYGHHIGDEVIIQIANIVERFSPEEAWACRWGGEELAVYLPDYQVDQGLLMATSILEATRNETDPSVTMSCGISAWISGRNDSARELFTRADQALYEAKNMGKNRIIIANHIDKRTEFVPY